MFLTFSKRKKTDGDEKKRDLKYSILEVYRVQVPIMLTKLNTIAFEFSNAGTLDNKITVKTKFPRSLPQLITKNIAYVPSIPRLDYIIAFQQILTGTRFLLSRGKSHVSLSDQRPACRPRRPEAAASCRGREPSGSISRRGHSRVCCVTHSTLGLEPDGHYSIESFDHVHTRQANDFYFRTYEESVRHLCSGPTKKKRGDEHEN